MKAKYSAIAAACVALWSAIVHPLARAMDKCTAMIAALCSIEPPPPSDNLEPHPELAIVERASAEQAPPPAAAPMPASRGMTWAMQDEAPIRWPNSSASFNRAMHLLRNGAAARVSAPSLVQPRIEKQVA